MCVSVLPSSQTGSAPPEAAPGLLSHPALDQGCCPVPQRLLSGTGEISGMTHSSALFKRGVNIIQLLSILKEKKKKRDFMGFLSTAHGRATGRLHCTPVNSQIHFYFMGDISHFFHQVRGESASCPPPILSSTKMFH